MGVRAERRERRAKAEKEIEQALLDSLFAIEEKHIKWTLLMLERELRTRVSQDTQSRFPDIIRYEMQQMLKVVERTNAKREGGDENG